MIAPSCDGVRRRLPRDDPRGVACRVHDFDRLEPIAARSNEADDGGGRVARSNEFRYARGSPRGWNRRQEATCGLRIEQERIVWMRRDRVEVADGAAKPHVLRLQRG